MWLMPHRNIVQTMRCSDFLQKERENGSSSSRTDEKENKADKFDPFVSRRSFANENDRDTNKLKYYIGR